jgi:hypothetical protein
MPPSCESQRGGIESEICDEGNLEASVRSRDTDDAERSERDFIEAGLN